MALPASGSQVEMRSVDIWRAEDCMFVEHWDELNLVEVSQQMGALAGPGEPAPMRDATRRPSRDIDGGAVSTAGGLRHGTSSADGPAPPGPQRVDACLGSRAFNLAWPERRVQGDVGKLPLSAGALQQAAPFSYEYFAPVPSQCRFT